MRHEQLEAEAPIQDLAAGAIISARGEVTATRLVKGGGKKTRFEAVLHDGASRLDLVWFNAAYMKDRIHPGMRLRVQGKARRFGYGLQLANPSYETINPDKDEPARRDERLRPVYPASERIDSKAIESIIARALPLALPNLDDHFDQAYLKQRSLVHLARAYELQHAPETLDDVAQSRRRLAYDELLLLQLGVQLKRAETRTGPPAPIIPRKPALDAAVRKRLPFTLTRDQEQVIDEITRDLAQAVPMNRLLQGDVGSGKTAVALYAMLLAVAAKHQAALMAPTEILAEQHHATISRILQGSRVRIELLTGSLNPSERDAAHDRIAAGHADLVIGTHALLSEPLRFHALALAVIDEQHRFGVHQRARLRAKSDQAAPPHVLVMTATPIPRTLALTLFGDLDVSTIRHLPPGRGPIRTHLAAIADRPAIYQQLRQALQAGEQAYIVVPAIDASDDADPDTTSDRGPRAIRASATIEGLRKELEAGPLTDLRIAVVHGRLNRAARDAVMERFRLGHIQALLATTVIEVGVDVPNATRMVIEDADRFGLAQLHQLRGRIGRDASGRESHCTLIADLAQDAPPTPPPDAPLPSPHSVLGSPHSALATPPSVLSTPPSPLSPSAALERLQALASTTDGFALAERDFELRGMGEVIGQRQSGLAPFRVVEFPRDHALLLLARKDAAATLAGDPTLAKPAHATLRRRLLKAHGQSLDLAEIA